MPCLTETAPALPELIALAVPLCQQAEAACPRTGPGRPPDIPDWLLATLVLVAVLRRKKSKSAQYRFLAEHRAALAAWLGSDRFPARSTYFDRYRRAHRLLQKAIALQGATALAEGVTAATVVAVDKSLLAGRGPAWHRHQRRAGEIPAGTDTETTWSYSTHDGWVQGYSFEVVVTATPDTCVFPLLASVDTANASETKTFADKIGDLPAGTRAVLADSGYDANRLGEQVEYDAKGRRTGRRFLCPQNPRNNKRPKTKPCAADAARARSRGRRQQRRVYLESARGRRLYARRKKTVEPFNSWFKGLFELEGPVWHRRLDNNQTQVLAALFAYQLLVRYNHRHRRPLGQIKDIVDRL